MKEANSKLCTSFLAALDSFVVMPTEQEILPGQTVPFNFDFKPVSYNI